MAEVTVPFAAVIRPSFIASRRGRLRRGFGLRAAAAGGARQSRGPRLH